MRRRCTSLDEARRVFEEYVRLEPRLKHLWDMCRCAAPPEEQAAETDDVFATDPHERDAAAFIEPGDSWSAEDHFLQQVKPRLLRLVGTHRPGKPHALHSREAYEDVYDVLLYWALDERVAICQ